MGGRKKDENGHYIIDASAATVLGRGLVIFLVLVASAIGTAYELYQDRPGKDDLSVVEDGLEEIRQQLDDYKFEHRECRHFAYEALVKRAESETGGDER